MLEPIEISDLPLAEPTMKVRLGGRYGGCLAFTPDGKRLVVAKMMGAANAKVVALATGADEVKFETIPPYVRGIVVSDDGQLAVFASQSETVYICDPTTGAILRRLKVDNTGELSGLLFAPGSHTLLHSSWKGLTVINADEGSIERHLTVRAESIRPPMFEAAAFSSSGDSLAVSRTVFTENRAVAGISLFAWPAGSELDAFELGTSSSIKANRIAFSPDGETLVYKMSGGAVEARHLGASDASAAELIGSSFGNNRDSFQSSFDMAGDGSLFAYVRKEFLGLWDWRSRRRIGMWRLAKDELDTTQVRFSPDCRYLAFELVYGGVYIYEVAGLLKTATASA